MLTRRVDMNACDAAVARHGQAGAPSIITAALLPFAPIDVVPPHPPSSIACYFSTLNIPTNCVLLPCQSLVLVGTAPLLKATIFVRARVAICEAWFGSRKDYAGCTSPQPSVDSHFLCLHSGAGHANPALVCVASAPVNLVYP